MCYVGNEVPRYRKHLSCLQSITYGGTSEVTGTLPGTIALTSSEFYSIIQAQCQVASGIQFEKTEEKSLELAARVLMQPLRAAVFCWKFEMSEPELIPFGKYRGMPVDAVIEDRQYAEWLIAQAWFRERYQNLYVTIQNGGAQSDMTPEHNRMQARFLDDLYLDKFFDRILKSVNHKPISGKVPPKIDFEVNGWDVLCQFRYQWLIDTTDERWVFNEEKQCNEFRSKFGEPTIGEINVFVELKPIISDDFPAVMRQVKSRRIDSSCKPIVLCDSFDQHSAVPFDSVRKMFLSSGILLIQSSEIE